MAILLFFHGTLLDKRVCQAKIADLSSPFLAKGFLDAKKMLSNDLIAVLLLSSCL